MKQNKQPMSQIKGRIDWSTVIIPFLSILALCLCFILAPETSKQVLGQIRTLFGDTFGLFYLIVGLGVFLLSIIWPFPNTAPSVWENREKSRNTMISSGAA